MSGKSVTLAFYGQFHCLGDQCPASCCANWTLDVDKDTYERWATVSVEADRQALLDSVRPVTSGYGDILKQKDNGECIHLEDKLCTIQRRYGHDFLPLTCRKYPRIYTHDEMQDVHSLALSCPEVLNRLFADGQQQRALLLKKTMTVDFQAAEQALLMDPVFGRALLKIVNEVMSLPKYEPSVFLYFIGSVLCNVAKKSEQGELRRKDVNDMHKRLKPDLFQSAKTAQRRIDKLDKHLNVQFWRLLDSIMPNARDLLAVDDSADLDECIDLLKTPDIDMDGQARLHGLVMAMRDQARSCLPASYNDNMRSYLIVKFLNNRFPWNPVEGNVIAAYLYCVIPYALIQLLVWMQVRVEGGIDGAEIKRIIYSVERHLNHNKRIYRLLSEHEELLHLDEYLDCLILL